MVRLFFPSILLLVFTSSAFGQADAKALLNAYAAERADVLTRFPAESLAAADAVAAKAETALVSNPALAAKLAREARWQLPYVPPGLPPHISRVLGACRLRHADRVNALAYSPDGQWLATVSRDGTVKCWDLASGRERWTYRDLGELGPTEKKEVNDDVLKVASVAWSKTNVLACGGYGQIHLIDPQTGKLVKALKGHEGTVKSLAFRADGKILASIGDDKTIRIWDSAKGTELTKIEMAKAQPNQPVPQLGRFESIAYSPKGDQVAAVNQDGRMVVYDVSGKEGKLKFSSNVVSGVTAVLAVKYTPDGTGLFSAGDVSNGNNPRLTAGPAADSAPVNPATTPAPVV